MCGIAGFLSARKNTAIDKNHIGQMIKCLNHRGPDGYGFHLDDKNSLAMGHARLSIIDLQTGDQPIFGPDTAQTVITGNGEFYDYKRIRANLICEGHKFRTKSDSEIALHLYEKHGPDFVQHLRGEFGFALYDGKNDRLVLVRDRFGIKPVFFTVHNDTIYWASEIKAILAHPDIPRKLNRQALLHQLMHTMPPGMTAFEKIHALKPGYMLIVTRQGDSLNVDTRQYWDLDFPKEKARSNNATLDENALGVRKELMEAVQHRLEADVPVGCYLSGGIDSCSMLGLASAIQQSPVKAYTISFDHASYDESAIAIEMAKKTNADQELLKLTADDLYGVNYIRTMWHAERTFYNTLGVAKWCMSRRVHESGYKVVVTGEGSDELFGGYPAFKRDMILHGMRDKPEAERLGLMQQLSGSNKLFRGAILAENDETHAAFDALCGFTPSWIQPWMRTLQTARPLLSDEILRELDSYDPIKAIADCFDPKMIADRHPLDIAQYTWSKTMLECQILNWGGDRVDMANSMESRPAFLDHHVAEFAVELPPEHRIDGPIEKRVLREAMKEILPETLYKREKFAFMAPPGHTEKRKQSALGQLIDQYLSDEAISEAGIFDQKRLRKFIDEYKSDTEQVSLTRKDALMNHILGLQILHSQFIEGNAPAEETHPTPDVVELARA